MSYFNTLPSDILILIITLLNCKSILSLTYICQSFRNFCLSNLLLLFRSSLHRVTNFNVNNYNITQLMNISQILPIKTHISTGFNYSLIKHQNGQIYTFNNNDNNHHIPYIISKLRNIKYISSKYNTSLALTNSGQVYAFNCTNHNIPSLIPNLNNIIESSLGYNHSLLLTSDKQVYVFGNNDNGQLGLGCLGNIYLPTIIPNLCGIASVAGGNCYSLVITVCGQVYGFGNNQFGQLGLKCRANVFVPTLVPGLDNVVAVSCGFSHSLALTVNRRVFIFGRHKYQDFSVSDSFQMIEQFDNVIAINAGHDQSLLLTSKGEVYGFGSNKYGQLGLPFGYANYIFLPILIPIFNRKKLANIIFISTGYYYSLVLSSNGDIYYFGSDDLIKTKDILSSTNTLPQLVQGLNIFSI